MYPCLITQPMRKEGKDHLSREYCQVKIEYLNKGIYWGPFHIQTTAAKYFPLYIFHNMLLTSNLLSLFLSPLATEIQAPDHGVFPSTIQTDSNFPT